MSLFYYSVVVVSSSFRYACEFCSSRQTTYIALGDAVFHGRKTEIWGTGGDAVLMVEVICENCGGRSKTEHS